MAGRSTCGNRGGDPPSPPLGQGTDHHRSSIRFNSCSWHCNLRLAALNLSMAADKLANPFFPSSPRIQAGVSCSYSGNAVPRPIEATTIFAALHLGIWLLTLANCNFPLRPTNADLSTVAIISTWVCGGPIWLFLHSEYNPVPPAPQFFPCKSPAARSLRVSHFSTEKCCCLLSRHPDLCWRFLSCLQRGRVSSTREIEPDQCRRLSRL